MAIGEVALVGGPFVAAAVIRMRKRLGPATSGDQSAPERSQTSETHVAQAEAPATMHASG
jgi:hypothetical protein